MMSARPALIAERVSEHKSVRWQIPGLAWPELFNLLVILYRKVMLIIALVCELLVVRAITFKLPSLPQRRDKAAPLNRVECLGSYEDWTHSSPPLNESTEFHDSSSWSAKISNDLSGDSPGKGAECSQIQMNQQKRSLQTGKGNGSSFAEMCIPLVGTRLNENDAQHRNECTPAKGNAEIRRWIFQRIALHGRKRQRIVRACYNRFYATNDGDPCTRLRNLPSADLHTSRQLFPRKRWGPVVDPNTFASASMGPQSCVRKRWGSVLNLDTIFYTYTKTLNLKRKRWGPVIDLKGLFNAKHRVSLLNYQKQRDKFPSFSKV